MELETAMARVSEGLVRLEVAVAEYARRGGCDEYKQRLRRLLQEHLVGQKGTQQDEPTIEENQSEHGHSDLQIIARLMEPR